MCWYDRQNVLCSDSISFITDFPYFVVLLLVFQRFEYEDWGIISTLVPKTKPYKGNDGKLVSAIDLSFTEFAEDGCRIRVDPVEPLYGRPVLKGRATRVLKARFLSPKEQEEEGQESKRQGDLRVQPLQNDIEEFVLKAY